MLIGDRLHVLREARKLSQGDIEARSGLKRSYISRVEKASKFCQLLARIDESDRRLLLQMAQEMARR